jgi:N-acyl homoserine lactone hydrolase
VTSLTRLYLIQLELTSLPTPKGPLSMALGCYLVQTDDGKNILIDSGLPADYTPPGTPPTAQTTNVIAQIGALGLRPEQIDILVTSHLDIDHVGYHRAFPQAELIVQRAEYEAGRSGPPRFPDARVYWEALHYRLVEGDTELVPGLELIATPGHSPGHQSILVRLPHTGPVLLTVDAVPMQRQFTPDRAPWPGDADPDQMRASTQKLIALAERERVTLVVFGHDGQQWPTLKVAPEWYE